MVEMVRELHLMQQVVAVELLVLELRVALMVELVELAQQQALQDHLFNMLVVAVDLQMVILQEQVEPAVVELE
tara:strand:+ start:264 stop:482 length:219 start_codon:yes stop_codon:yes gene_type:complete